MNSIKNKIKKYWNPKVKLKFVEYGLNVNVSLKVHNDSNCYQGCELPLKESYKY